QACANGIHMNRGCPSAAVGYPGMKPQQHCPGELQQQSDTSSLLRQTHLGNGYDPQSHQIMSCCSPITTAANARSSLLLWASQG
ncbi:BOC isoform 16, partial [Pan troglodytes]